MEYVSRCRACSALVRRDQDWCTLCHTDLRPPERRPSAPPEPSPPVEEPADEPLDPLEASLALLLADREAVAAVPATPTAPLGKHARGPEAAADLPVAVPTQVAGERASAGVSALTGGANPPDDAELALMIARLAAETGDPIAGAASRLPDSQSMRVALALAVGLGVAAVVIFVTWLLGLAFG
jgi:hypothetical protein